MSLDPLFHILKRLQSFLAVACQHREGELGIENVVFQFLKTQNRHGLLLQLVEGEFEVKPSGLAPDFERSDLMPAQLREMVSVLEPCAGVPAKHVRVLDIPRPHRKAFMDSMTGSTVPFRKGESALGVVFAHGSIDIQLGHRRSPRVGRRR